MFSTTLFSQTIENEQEYACGIHLHLAYNIPNTKFGIGLNF